MQKSNFHHGGTEATEVGDMGKIIIFFLRTLRASVVRLCFGLLLSALPAAAAEVRFDGSYRLRFNSDSNLLLDDQSFASQQQQWAEHRLRLTPKIVEIGEQGALEIQSSFDIVSGIVAGDTAADFRRFRFARPPPPPGPQASGLPF